MTLDENKILKSIEKSYAFVDKTEEYFTISVDASVDFGYAPWVQIVPHGDDTDRFRIDFGDGNVVTHLGRSSVYHEYAELGFYNVRILEADTMMFSIRTDAIHNISGALPLFRPTNWDTIDLNRIFYTWEGEHFSIPHGFFRNYTDLPSVGVNPQIDFNQTFMRTNINTVPGDLLHGIKNIRSFSQMFSESALETIPEELFDNIELSSNTLLRGHFGNTFANCSNLTGMAPQIWEMFPFDGEENQCFRNCFGLSNYDEIPDNWK
jgi:hypothetical protein